MSKPEPEWLLASWVRLVQARWAATGVPRADRTVLLRQLLQDLAAARAGGASINELVATPPAVFADSCAAGLTSRFAEIDLLPLLGVCLGTGVVVAGVAWFALVAGVQALDNAGAGSLDAPWFGLSVDLFLALAVLAAMLSAVRGRSACSWRRRCWCHGSGPHSPRARCSASPRPLPTAPGGPTASGLRWLVSRF